MLPNTSRFAWPIALAVIAAAQPVMHAAAHTAPSLIAQTAPTPPVDPDAKPVPPSKPAQPVKPTQPMKPSKTSKPSLAPNTEPRPTAPTTPTVATQEGALKHNEGALALLAQASNIMCAASLKNAKSWRVEIETVRIERDKPTAPIEKKGRFIIRAGEYRDNDIIRDVMLHSPLPAIAGAVMRASKINVYDDQVLVKEAGSAARTAFHQDQG